MISETTINQVFESMDIYEVVSDFVDLKKAGASWKGKSPFCEEKTPSFFVVPGKQIYKCFSSGKGGNAGDLRERRKERPLISRSRRDSKDSHKGSQRPYQRLKRKP